MNSILVTGATGNVGRPLVAQLVSAGAEVCAVTRDPKAARFPDGVQVVSSAVAGLDGAYAMFLNSRALGDELAPMVKAARQAGVTRLVALSAINADDDFSRQPSRFRGDRNKEVEQYAVDSGLEWVSLRPTVFVSNFFDMWAPQISAGDVIVGPFARASTAPISDRDVSAVAARALLTDELVGQRIPLTGPQALTNAELVDIVGGVLGRRLSYREIPAAQVRQRFVDMGFSTGFADAYITLLAATVDTSALVTHEVEKILGRLAESFADSVSANQDLFTNYAGRENV